MELTTEQALQKGVANMKDQDAKYLSSYLAIQHTPMLTIT